MTISIPITAAVAILIGAVIGYFLRQFIAQHQKDTSELRSKKLFLDAKESAQRTLDEANSRAEKILGEVKEEQKERIRDLRRREERLTTKDEILEKREQTSPESTKRKYSRLKPPKAEFCNG